MLQLYLMDLPLLDFDKMSKDLLKFRESLGLWLAGHVHRNMNYSVNTLGAGIKIIDVRETAANKEFENGLFTLVHVYKIPVATSTKDYFNTEKIKIHPNPVSDVLNIEILENSKIQNINVFSINGDKVYSTQNAQISGKNLSINTSQFPQGMYFIQIQGDNKIYLKNFIKTN
jgi:hypothetical protein